MSFHKVRAPDRRGNSDNFSDFLIKTYVVTPINCLGVLVLLKGHKVDFYRKIWKIIPKLFPLLIWSTDKMVKKKT